MKILGIEIHNDLKPVTEKLRDAFRGNFDQSGRAFGLDSPEARAFFSAQDGVSSDTQVVTKQEAFSRNTWVHRCVMKNAETIASLPFIMRKGEKEVLDHPLLTIIKRPNPYFSESDLWQMTLCALNLYGEAFWLLNRNSFDGLQRAATDTDSVLAYPKSIWTVNPRQVDAVLSTDKQVLLAWRLSLPGIGRQDVDPNDVVHFRFPNVFNPWRGTSPLDAAALSITSDQASQKYNLGVFVRGAIPSGVLVAQGKLNPQQAAEIVSKFEARHRDSHRPAILHSGLDYKETQMSNHDMEFKELRRMNREDILAAFGVPPVVVGLLEYASYASADLQNKLYWVGTLIPQADLLCNAIKKQMMKGEPDELRPEFDRSHVEVLQEDIQKKLDTAKRFFDIGYPINAINDRLKLGMPKTDWGDTGFLPFALSPVENLINPPEQSPAPVGGNQPDLEDAKPPSEVNAFSWGRLAAKADRIAMKHAVRQEIADGADEMTTIALPHARLRELAEAPVECVTGTPDERIEVAVSRMASARAAAATEKKLAKILSILQKDKKELRLLAKQYLSQATDTGIKQINSMLGTGFDVADPKVVDFIENKIVLIADIEETTKEWIRDLVAASVAENWTIEELADRIREDYNLGPDRAYRIARTETASSVNGGRYLTMEAEGVKEHEWLTSRGPNVRMSHREEEGHVVKVGTEFPVTGLTYPGEPEGPPEEIINCQCVTVPAIATARAYARGKDAYWDELFGQRALATSLQKRFGKAISKHFNAQRNSILKILLN